MDVAISAIGTAVPRYRSQQLETADLIAEALQLRPAEKRLLKSVYKATGIEYRHSVLQDYVSSPGHLTFFPNLPDAPFPTTSQRMQVYEENALALSCAAIEDCLRSKTVDASQITHVITVSCTGMYAPGLDIELVHQLKLPLSTKRTAINFMGCYGAFNALKVADAICRAEQHAKVLIVCVELCTLHFQRDMKMDNMISNAIFADGAAAVIVEAYPSVQKYLTMSSFYCDLLPQASHAMAWHVADSGFDIVLSNYVPEAIEIGIPTFLAKFLKDNQRVMADVDFFAIHPGGLKILQACEQALGISVEQNRFSYQVLQQYGNMSSATILFVLKEIWHAMHQSDHQKTIFSCAFGPGLTLESMLLTTHCQ